MTPKRYFRVKTWEKFTYPMQRALLKKYDVILTDHKTGAEFALALLSKFSVRDFQKAMDKFDGMMAQFDAKKNLKIFPDQGEITGLAPDRDYTPLTGKGKNITFWSDM